MVSSLAPKAYSTASAERKNTADSTRPTQARVDTQLPRIRSASPYSPRPMAMEALGAPPAPIREANAATRVITGSVTPRPVRARAPTPSIWPI